MKKLNKVNINRRDFLRRTTAGLVASATMAEAGALAEFLDWMRRKPKFSLPSKLPPQKFPYDVLDTWHDLLGVGDIIHVDGVAYRVTACGWDTRPIEVRGPMPHYELGLFTVRDPLYSYPQK